MIKITQSGSLNNFEKFLKNCSNLNILKILNDCGKQGVMALELATPIDSGITAKSWSYDVFSNEEYHSVNWYNSETAGSVPLAVIIQYGHATRNGSFVEGRDFINPALRPILDKLAKDIWKEVTNA